MPAGSDRHCQSWWLAALVAILFVAAPAGGAAAQADAPPKKSVLLIVDRPAGPFAERIRAEIEALGLRTIVLESWRAPERAEPMDAAAREQHASAAIRVVPSRRGVEIWMADETSGRSLLRQLIVDDSPGGPDENLVAMQLVELLRTSLRVEPQPEAKPPLPPPPPPPPPLQLAKPAPHEEHRCVSSPWRCPRAQAGIGALTAFGGTGVELHGWLSLQAMISRRLGLALDLAAPIMATSVSGPEGSATLTSSLFGVAMVYRLDDGRSRLSAEAALGAELVRLSASGKSSLFPAASPHIMTEAGYARLDGGIEIAPWLRVVLRVTAGVAVDAIQIRFSGNDAAEWGRFFGAASVLIDFGRR